MSTNKELQDQLDKVKSDRREDRKEIRELKEIIKEKDITIKFMTEQLGNAYDRLLLSNQKLINITVDEVVAFNKLKADHRKERELAQALEQQERNNQKLKQGVASDNTS